MAVHRIVEFLSSIDGHRWRWVIKKVNLGLVALSTYLSANPDWATLVSWLGVFVLGGLESVASRQANNARKVSEVVEPTTQPAESEPVQMEFDMFADYVDQPEPTKSELMAKLQLQPAFKADGTKGMPSAAELKQTEIKLQSVKPTVVFWHDDHLGPQERSFARAYDAVQFKLRTPGALIRTSNPYES